MSRTTIAVAVLGLMGTVLVAFFQSKVVRIQGAGKFTLTEQFTTYAPYIAGWLLVTLPVIYVVIQELGKGALSIDIYVNDQDKLKQATHSIVRREGNAYVVELNALQDLIDEAMSRPTKAEVGSVISGEVGRFVTADDASKLKEELSQKIAESIKPFLTEADATILREKLEQHLANTVRPFLTADDAEELRRVIDEKLAATAKSLLTVGDAKKLVKEAMRDLTTEDDVRRILSESPQPGQEND